MNRTESGTDHEVKVRITCGLPHPFDSRWETGSGIWILPGASTKSKMIAQLGEENYRFAVQEGWIVEGLAP